MSEADQLIIIAGTLRSIEKLPFDTQLPGAVPITNPRIADHRRCARRCAELRARCQVNCRRRFDNAELAAQRIAVERREMASDRRAVRAREIRADTDPHSCSPECLNRSKPIIEHLDASYLVGQLLLQVGQLSWLNCDAESRCYLRKTEVQAHDELRIVLARPAPLCATDLEQLAIRMPASLDFQQGSEGIENNCANPRHSAPSLRQSSSIAPCPARPASGFVCTRCSLLSAGQPRSSSSTASQRTGAGKRDKYVAICSQRV